MCRPFGAEHQRPTEPARIHRGPYPDLESATASSGSAVSALRGKNHRVCVAPSGRGGESSSQQQPAAVPRSPPSEASRRLVTGFPKLRPGLMCVAPSGLGTVDGAQDEQRDQPGGHRRRIRCDARALGMYRPFRFPRASPWADMCLPFGAGDRRRGTGGIGRKLNGLRASSELRPESRFGPARTLCVLLRRGPRLRDTGLTRAWCSAPKGRHISAQGAALGHRAPSA